MMNVATVTMNPTIDIAYEVDELRPTHKMRADCEHADPGGGGINVARVFVRLGGNATCHYLSGGATGAALDGLLDLHQLVKRPVRIAGQTRIATNVFERASGKEYRFVPEGPSIAESEWQACLDQLEQAECDYLVASGSLPPGVPQDFYARLGVIAKEKGVRLVLDTSGPAMGECLAGGGVHLVKPSIGELSQLAGCDFYSPGAIADAALELVLKRKAEMVAVTMGHEGAIFASGQGVRFVPALDVAAKSAVGAGDSFLAAMVWALAKGWEPFDAFRYGMAAGSAAVLTPGTGLSLPADIERLHGQLLEQPLP